MRLKHALLAAFIAIALVSYPAILRAITTTSLQGYWKLDNGALTTDSHGANTLTNNATVTNAAGKINDGGDFEADTLQSLSLADNSSLSTGNVDFTIGCWAKFESLGAARSLMAKGTASAEYFLRYASSTTFLTFSVNGVGVAGLTPSTDTWYHVVGWHDSVNDQIGIAVNDGTPTTAAHAAGGIDTTGTFYIGADISGVNYMDGILDECFLFKRVLSAQDRTDLYCSGAGLAYDFSAGCSATPSKQLLLLGVGSPKDNLFGLPPPVEFLDPPRREIRP